MLKLGMSLGALLNFFLIFFISQTIGSLALKKTKMLYLTKILFGLYLLSILFFLQGILGLNSLTNINLIIDVLFVLSVMYWISQFTKNKKTIPHISIFKARMKSQPKLNYLREEFNSIHVLLWIFLVSANTGLILFNFRGLITGYDALAYHLYTPFYYANYEQAYDPLDLIPNAGLPPGSQGIWVWLFANGDFRGTSLFNLFIIISILYIFWKISHKNFISTRILLISFIFLSIISLGPASFLNPSSDLVLTLYSSVIFLELSRIKIYNYSEIKLLLFLSGFLPFIKPIGIVIVPCIIYVLWRHKQSNNVWSFWSFSCLSLMPSIFWSLQNLVKTGNPIYPLMTGFFQTKGFGPEVPTIESDVRGTLINMLSVFINFLSNPSRHNLWVFSQFFLFFALTVLSLVYIFHIKRILPKSFSGIYITLSIMFLLVSSFANYRYLFFLYISQTISMFDSFKVIKFKKKVQNFPKIITANFCLIITLVILMSNQTVIITPQPILNKIGIGTIEEDFNEIVTKVKTLPLKNNEPLLLIGEGRALLFYPRKVYVLGFDRRNPFSNPSISSAEEAMQILKRTGSQYLILTSRWGFPSNVSLQIIEEFKDLFADQIVFENEAWSIIRIR